MWKFKPILKERVWDGNRISVALQMILTAMSIVLYTACGRAENGGNAVGDVAADSNEIPVPQVPDSIFDPLERADYVLLHFWDSISPDDDRMGDDKFLDYNFRRYAELFSYASPEGMAYAVATLLRQTEGYPSLYRKFASLAQKYLYRRGSQWYNEAAFLCWLKELAAADVLDAGEKSRYEYLLAAAQKNMPGTVAADFRFVDRSGAEQTLRSLPPAQYTLMVFYDPDCDTCHDIIAKIRDDRRLTAPVDAGTVRVLLVDIAEDRDLFAKDAATLPARWKVVYDLSRVEDNDIYIFDTTPTIYLLDREGRVIFKDATIDQLVEYARSQS